MDLVAAGRHRGGGRCDHGPLGAGPVAGLLEGAAADAARHRPGGLARLRRGAARLPAAEVAGTDRTARPRSSSATATNRPRPPPPQAIRDAIPGSALVTIAEAAHIPNFEQDARGDPRRPARIWTASPPCPPRRPMPAWSMRKRILGEAHVARSEAALTRDRRALPRLHPGRRLGPRLDPAGPVGCRDRSLLCLGILSALRPP